ncbi:uncharacterized protein LOC119596992 [Penaeus monodon]|uniref:uncharacterized protein LOC119596992 n=1 Tax=Penaeus monodon TaxID=6687 RepID=UPI0018A77017|nr:uncharacterized protein LOC119596992 [Penaeus monodon]
MDTGYTSPSTCAEYYQLGYMVSGRYRVDTDYHVWCSMEGRAMCKGSLFQGAAFLLSGMTTPDPDPDFVDMLNNLSPYIDPPTPFYETTTGVIEVAFDHAVLVRSVKIWGDPYNDGLVKAFRISYTYEDEAIYNITQNSEYHFSDVEFGSPTTLYTDFVAENATNTTSSPVDEAPVFKEIKLRPFVAHSIKITVVEPVGSARLKLDMVGCKYDIDTEVANRPGYGHGCYLFRTEQVTQDHFDPEAEYITGRWLATEEDYRRHVHSNIKALPIGKSGACGGIPYCSLLDTMLINTGQSRNCDETPIQEEINDLYAGLIDYANCTVTMHETFSDAAWVVETKFHRICPSKTYAMFQWAYEHYLNLSKKCIEDHGLSETPIPVRNETDKCLPTEPGEYISVGLHWRGHVDDQCRFSFQDEAYQMFPNQTFSFRHSWHFHQLGGGERYVVGRSVGVTCECPMTTVAPGNRDYLICLPDFSYYYQTFQGCVKRKCDGDLLPSPPTDGSSDWDNKTVEVDTMVTYRCPYRHMFQVESVQVPTIVSMCRCDEIWNVTSLPICVFNSTIPPSTTTTTSTTTTVTTSITTTTTTTTDSAPTSTTTLAASDTSSVQSTSISSESTANPSPPTITSYTTETTNYTGTIDTNATTAEGTGTTDAATSNMTATTSETTYIVNMSVETTSEG